METTGARTTVLQPFAQAVDHTGYMLFLAPGKWKVVFAQRSELLGSVTLEVGPKLLGVVGCPPPAVDVAAVARWTS